MGRALPQSALQLGKRLALRAPELARLREPRDRGCRLMRKGLDEPLQLGNLPILCLQATHEPTQFGADASLHARAFGHSRKPCRQRLHLIGQRLVPAVQLRILALLCGEPAREQRDICVSFRWHGDVAGRRIGVAWGTEKVPLR